MSSVLNKLQIFSLVYLFTASSLPKPPLPNHVDFAKWKGRKNANQDTITANSDDEKPLPSASPPSVTDDRILSDSRPEPSNGSKPKPTKQAPVPFPDKVIPASGKMNATFVTLARNTDLWDIVESIRQVEDRFNRHYHYDWVFLNDKDFDDDFKEVTTALISGETKYGRIPEEHWSYPDWIDKNKAKKVREDMAERKVIYGDSESYRHMCRFESGFFFRHPLMLDYEWYWRVEPNVKLFCDISFDPFRFMAEHKKLYSFVISLYEYIETIPTIWDSAKKFMKQNPHHVAQENGMKWLSEDDGETYNKCHFVSGESFPLTSVYLP